MVKILITTTVPSHVMSLIDPYPSLQEHFDAVIVTLLPFKHSIATEFKPHTSPGVADVIHSPTKKYSFNKTKILGEDP